MSNVQKSNTVSNRSKEKEGISITSSIGGLIPHISLTPLTDKTNTPAFRKDHPMGKIDYRYEWSETIEGLSHDFFLEIWYSQTPDNDFIPNCHIEDDFLILNHLAQELDYPERIPFSLYKVHALRSYRHNQSKQQIQRWTRSLYALWATGIKTNATEFNTARGKFVARPFSVLSSFGYIDPDGTPRRTPVFKIEDGIWKRAGDLETTQEVKHLEDFSFNPEFIKYIIRPGSVDRTSFDLGIYLALQKHIPKRIYKYGSHHVQRFGEHARDLREFCRVVLRMSEMRINHPKVSKLARDIRLLGANRVSVMDGTGIAVQVTQSSSSDSGYVIAFAKADPKIVFTDLTLTSLTNDERKAFDHLRRIGLFQNVAEGKIIEARNEFGTNAAAYIKFVIQKLEGRRKRGELKAKEKNYFAAAVAIFLREGHYKAEFREYLARSRKVVRSSSNEAVSLAQILQKKSSPKAAPKTGSISLPPFYSLDAFESAFPDLVRAIARATKVKYDSSYAALMKENKISVPKKIRESDTAKAFSIYCKETYTALKRNQANYFPPDLEEYKN